MAVMVFISVLFFLYLAAYGMVLGQKMLVNQSYPGWIGSSAGLIISLASIAVGLIIAFGVTIGLYGIVAWLDLLPIDNYADGFNDTFYAIMLAIGLFTGTATWLGGTFLMYTVIDRTLTRAQETRIRPTRLASDAFSFYIVLLFAFILLFPYYWMIVTAFRPTAELIRLEDSLLWTKNPTFDNFQNLIDDTPFQQWMETSLTVSISTTIFSVTIGTLAAYALVRFRFPGSRVLGLSMFITYLVPPILLFIPMMTITRSISIPQPDLDISLVNPSISLTFENKQLYNSLWALIVVYPTFLVPFSTWFLMGFFRSIPPDMEECARVDGATYWQAFYKVTLPLARPGIVSAAIFSFTLSWGEYLYARSLILSKNLWTLPVGVPSELTSGDVFFWGLIMAAALLGSLPIVIIYSFFMRAFVSGMTAGAVKG